MGTAKCAFCNMPAGKYIKLKRCSRCSSTLYCSTKCQKSDYTVHKLICEKFKTFTTTTPRPSPTHKLAIILPADKPSPNFVWIDFKKEGGADIPLLFFDNEKTDLKYVSTNRVLSEAKPNLQRFALDHSIKIVGPELSLPGTSAPNECVITISKTIQTSSCYWNASYICLSQPSTLKDEAGFKDIIPADMGVIVAFFDHIGKDGEKMKYFATQETGLASMAS